MFYEIVFGGSDTVVTIKAVAERCGCSPATVSKALNGAPGVGRELVERIRAAAAEMGYVPNAAARALKMARTYSFGVVFREASKAGLAHEFFSLLLNGFKRRSEELGYDISFIVNRLGDRDFTYAEHARYRRYDGVALITVVHNDPYAQELADSGIPTVTVDWEFPGCGCVMSDNLQGMRDILEYVYSMGHRRIAFIHGEITPVTRVRVAAFYRVCGELGITIPEGYVIGMKYHDPPSSCQATKQLMALPEPPTCILYPDDISYLGGRKALDELGLSVPGDVSAVGYDGIFMSQMLDPKLTTLRQDADLMGVRAAEELVKAVEEDRAYIPGRIVIPGELLKGQTVRKL